MALPQIQNTAEGRQFLDLMKDQKENIASQTKIMQTISTSIIRQGREATELRKEISNLRKGFVTGKSSNLEDIKKYFGNTRKDAPVKSAPKARKPSCRTPTVTKIFWAKYAVRKHDTMSIKTK